MRFFFPSGLGTKFGKSSDPQAIPRFKRNLSQEILCERRPFAIQRGKKKLRFQEDVTFILKELKLAKDTSSQRSRAPRIRVAIVKNLSCGTQANSHISKQDQSFQRQEILLPTVVETICVEVSYQILSVIFEIRQRSTKKPEFEGTTKPPGFFRIIWRFLLQCIISPQASFPDYLETQL